MKRTSKLKNVLWTLGLGVVLSCSGQKTASFQDAEFSSDMNLITGISLLGSGENSRVQVEAAQELKYNVFKLSDPERIVVDLIDARAGRSIPDRLAGNDLIEEVRIQSIEDSLSTLVRLEVKLASSANYLSAFEQDRLVIRVLPDGADMNAFEFAEEPFLGFEEEAFDFESESQLPLFGESLSEEDEALDFSFDSDTFEPSLEGLELSQDFETSAPMSPPVMEEPELPMQPDLAPVPAPMLGGLGVEDEAEERAQDFIQEDPVEEMARVPAELPAPPVPVIEPEVVEIEDLPVETPTQVADSTEDRNRVIVEPEGEIPARVQTQDIPTTLFTEGTSLVGSIDSRVYTGTRVSLEFQNADIQDVIRLIADVSRLNIVISDNVQGRITLKLVDVPWDQALDIILTARGLDKVQHGNILRVAPVEELKKEREIALANDQAAKQLEPLRLKLFNVNYADASNMAERIQNLLSERGKVDTDERTNTLIVEDIAENLSRIENLVKVLDTQTPQVRIESRIVQANDNFTRSIGVQWGPTLRLDESNNQQTSFQFPRTVNVNTIPPNPLDPSGPANTPLSFGIDSGSISEFAVDAAAGTGSGALGLRLGSVSDVFNIDLILRYAEAEQAAKIVSRPSITVLDNEEASIIQGSRIPFLSTSSEGTQVQFQEAGIEIRVKPQITNDGAVILQVETRSNEPGSTAVAGNPIINIREASTQMLVRSGNTAVLGGVFRTAETFGTGGVPGLRNLPVVGWLFKGESKGVNRDEMLIFITPYILSDSRSAQIAPNSESDLRP